MAIIPSWSPWLGMGFRWTISPVLLYFLVFLSSVLFSALVFLIGNWSIVYLWDIFLFVMFLYFFSFLISPLLDFIVRGGPGVLGHGAEFRFLLRDNFL